jgi:hypothetical protein
MWKTVAPILTGICLFVAISAMASAALQGQDDKPPKSSFAGLISDKSIDKLVKPTDKRVNNSPFALSIISDAKAFQAFTDAARLKNSPFDVDWDKQAVVVVVLKEHTYRLRFKQWTAKDNIGELTCYWDGIEPFYHDRFPALMYRFDKNELKKVVVKCDFDYLRLNVAGVGAKDTEKVLGEIPCPSGKERGKELAALEKKMLGIWKGRGGCDGRLVFRADGTYELTEYGPAPYDSAGTWRVRWDALPATLVLTCKTAEVPDAVGKTMEVKLINLDDNRLAFKYASNEIGHYTRVKK